MYSMYTFTIYKKNRGSIHGERTKVRIYMHDYCCDCFWENLSLSYKHAYPLGTHGTDRALSNYCLMHCIILYSSYVTI